MSSDAGDDIVIAARAVGKCYHLFARPQDRLLHTLWRGRRPYARPFWALRQVSFDLRRGEALGVIGRNGSGKSTLLQILAGTLGITEGQVRIHGRVGALLELGSGFNGEYTGRQNVLMQGVILGFTPAQVQERFDAIAAFADIGQFMDQPVKTYSSGMFVRLAFAVQVQLDPQILLVDEALAVGDIAFQFKCISYMKQLLERGVSIILVAHDVHIVRSFCRRALWLKDGQTQMQGEPAEVTAAYVRYLFEAQPATAPPPSAQPSAGGNGHAPAPPTLKSLTGRDGLVRWGSGQVVVEAIALTDDQGRNGAQAAFEHGSPMRLTVQLRAAQDIDLPNLSFAFSVRNTAGLDILSYTSYEAGIRFPPLTAGQTVALGFEWDNILHPGDYAVVLAVEDAQGAQRVYLDFVENAALFQCVSMMHVFGAVRPPVRLTALDGVLKQEAANA